MSNFEEKCIALKKCIEIAEKFPLNMREEVLRILLDEVKNENFNGDDSYRELILKLTNKGEELVSFITDKKAVSNIERSLLFVYFLNSKGIERVSAKQIEFCYALCAELCQFSVPGNLIQNLRDTCSARYGYLETNQGSYFVTEKGRAFCENI